MDKNVVISTQYEANWVVFKQSKAFSTQFPSEFTCSGELQLYSSLLLYLPYFTFFQINPFILSRLDLYNFFLIFFIDIMLLSIASQSGKYKIEKEEQPHIWGLVWTTYIFPSLTTPSTSCADPNSSSISHPARAMEERIDCWKCPAVIRRSEE